MKLQEVIKLAAEGDKSIGFIRDAASDREHIQAARKFLYGQNYTDGADNQISEATSVLINNLGLTGDNFTFIQRGGHGTVYGNDDVVLRLESSKWTLKGYLSIKNIPEGLTAKIINEGECNGVKFRVSERLNTKTRAVLQDIIPFLFKARDMGVVYEDAVSDNFGYDQGHIKVLDYKHFQRFGRPEGNFESSLRNAVETRGNIELPLITKDESNTYVVFPTESSSRMQQQLLDILSPVGIGEDNMEIIDFPPIVRISVREITYGIPLETEDLADYINQNLRKVMRRGELEEPARELHNRLSALLDDGNTQSRALLDFLPSVQELASMNREAFLEFYDELIGRMEHPGTCSSNQVDAVDGVIDQYFRDNYPVQGRGA